MSATCENQDRGSGFVSFGLRVSDRRLKVVVTCRAESIDGTEQLGERLDVDIGGDRHLEHRLIESEPSEMLDRNLTQPISNGQSGRSPIRRGAVNGGHGVLRGVQWGSS